jgi:hypothetical protein
MEARHIARIIEIKGNNVQTGIDEAYNHALEITHTFLQSLHSSYINGVPSHLTANGLNHGGSQLFDGTHMEIKGHP